MKNFRFLLHNAAFLFIAPAILFLSFSSVFAQQGNSISGYVFGYEREPIYDAFVELLNEFGQPVKRTRTENSGRFVFFGMPAGRFSVRVTAYGTDYEEQTQEVEIVNFTRAADLAGNQRISGYSNEQLDFNLRLRKGLTPGKTGTIFVQEVPDAAKKLYQQAISDLNNKKDKEGIAGLKAAIDAFPKYFAALERLGNEYVRLKYYDAAQYLFSAALEVNPRGYRSWYGLAYAYHSLNKFNDASFAIEKSIEIFQGSAEAYLLSGILKRMSKKFEDAEKHLLKAKELSKESMSAVHFQLALLYGNDMKRYADAAKELKLYLKAEPDAQDKEKIESLIKTYEEKAKK